MKTYYKKRCVSLLTLNLVALMFVWTTTATAREASNYPVCGNAMPTGTDTMCVLTPTEYESKLYEIALCTKDPMLGDTLDKASCSTVYSDTAGTTFDPTKLMSGAEQLSGTITRPVNGKYGFAYAIADKKVTTQVKMEVTQEYGKGTWYSTDTSVMTNVAANAAAFTDDFKNWSNVAGTCDPEYINVVTSLGHLDAYLLTESLSKAIAYESVLHKSGLYMQDTCKDVAKIIGVQTNDVPTVITSKTKTLNLAFQITDTGGLLIDLNRDGLPNVGYAGTWLGVFSTTLED